MSISFDRYNCTSSVYLQLQVTILMLLRTICSFHGNDSRRLVVVWADVEQAIVNNAIDLWRKTPGLCERQRRTPWTLAVIGCSLLCDAIDALFQTT